MQPFCSWRRVPRAGVDPIDSASSAMSVLSLAVHRPLTPETIVLLLDDERRGVSIVVVDGTDDPNAVVLVVECLAEAVAEATPATSLVVASVRPGDGVLDDDPDRWLEASDVAAQRGVELVEWFVFDGDDDALGVHCPRDDLGERPRW